jgi:hypothetical protein
MCKYTTIFTTVDEFCKIHEERVSYKLLLNEKQIDRNGKLSLREDSKSNDFLIF